MAYLLDVNVLLALLDSAHIHHAAASRWFAAYGKSGWASSPVTQNGFVRVISGTSYPNLRISPSEGAEALRTFASNFPGQYQFWEDEVSLTNDKLLDLAVLTGSKQITDVYLAGLAHLRGGRVATLDAALPWRAVRGATADLVALIPS